MIDENDGSAPRARSHRARVTPNAQASRILASARRLFLERGFAGASIDMIVADAGGSKREIYRIFGDKNGLFQRVVADACEARLISMRAAPASLDFEEALAYIALSFINLLLSDRILSLHRLVVTDAAHLDDAGLAFIKAGPDEVYRVVEKFLIESFGEARLSSSNASEAARIFIDSFSGEFQLRALLGEANRRDRLEKRINFAVSIFTAGLQQRFGPVQRKPVVPSPQTGADR